MPEVTTDRKLATLADAASGVLSKLDETRRGLIDCRIRSELSSLLLIELAALAVLMFADWLWVLPTIVRGLGLMGVASFAIVAVVRALRRRGESRHVAAVEVEARFRELGQRLRTVVQYAAAGAGSAPASSELLLALGRDTEHRTSPLDFRALVPWAACRRRLLLLAAGVGLGIVVLCTSPEGRTAALRMLLIPAHYTTLGVEPGDATVKAGDAFAIEVTLAGRPVRSARWLYRSKESGSQWTSASLAPRVAGQEPAASVRGTLTAGLKNCQSDLDYRVVAGEVESPVYHVTVIHPLELNSVKTAITSPAYTHRPPETIDQGDCTVIEGSSLRLAITLNRTPASAAVILGEKSQQKLPLKIEGATLSALLPAVTQEMAYQIVAVDDAGMKLGPNSFRIKVTPDREPTLRFVEPTESLGVTPIAEVPIVVKADDDFGVSRLAIQYKVGDGPEETLHLADLKNEPVTAEALVTLYLEKHEINFNDGVTYYAYVLDNYPGGPHRTVSELRFIDILPFKRRYRLAEPSGDIPANVSVSLEELIARQRVNLNRTFVAERDRTIDVAAVMRLATFEEELSVATAEFSAGLRGVGGQVSALDEAVNAMRAATRDLDAKQLGSAFAHEETALKALIAARRNLERLLAAQPGPSMASDVRKFDRQEIQKLRRPRPDESQDELEADLDELAEREKAFSEEIEAKGGGGPKFDPPDENGALAQRPVEPQSATPPDNPAAGQGTTSNPGEPSRPDLAQQQRQAAKEAERLRRLAEKDRTLSELARQRLQAAAAKVEEATRAMEAGRSAEAAEKARDAARELRAVARQVGALKARELADALARQRDLARSIARAERSLAESLESTGNSGETAARPDDPLARQQRSLADDVSALAEVLARTRSGAALEERELAQTIDRALRQNPPADLETAMRRNAEVIRSGRKDQAVGNARVAADRLDALAQDLESVRRAAVQPQLERLLAAEKKAADLQERLRSMRRPSQRAEAERGMRDLEGAVERLNPGDGSLRRGLSKLHTAVRSRHGGDFSQVDENTRGTNDELGPFVEYDEAVASVVTALQEKIQELMLDSALADRDGPVPPRYKELVEEYYRLLSQDLR